MQQRHCRCPVPGDAPPGHCRPQRRWEDAHFQARGWGPEGEVLPERAAVLGVPFPVDFRVSAGRAFTMLDLLPNANSLSQTKTALRAWYGCLSYQLVGR